MTLRSYSKDDQLKRAEKVKKTKVIRKKRRSSKKKPTVKLRRITDLKKECWYWLSLYVRLYWADNMGFVICATTGAKRYYYKSGVDAGHFVTKSSGGVTAFMFENIFPQSKGSNMKASGDQFLMGRHIDKLHLEGKTKYSADELIRLNKQSSIKLNRLYFEEKIVEYRKQVLDLSKEKNIWDWKSGCLKKYLKDVN